MAEEKIGSGAQSDTGNKNQQKNRRYRGKKPYSANKAADKAIDKAIDKATDKAADNVAEKAGSAQNSTQSGAQGSRQNRNQAAGAKQDKKQGGKGKRDKRPGGRSREETEADIPMYKRLSGASSSAAMSDDDPQSLLKYKAGGGKYGMDAPPQRPDTPEEKARLRYIPDHWFEDDKKPEPEPYDESRLVEIVGVRFKETGKVYYFAPMGYKCAEGQNVIVETARGLEYGTIAMDNRLERPEALVAALRPVVRIATGADMQRHLQNTQREAEALEICQEKVTKHQLDMKLIEAEYTFDNSKLTFYFSADGRIDFRELVKDLASVFRTRIELRQIGIRDEAKLLGGLGICGRPFCCSTFLYDFNQVSIRMAKEQNLSLNSAKISGTCGRLMCCLRYECEAYEEELKRTPRVDSIVKTKDGEGYVIETQALAGIVKVKLGDAADAPVKSYHRDEVTVTGRRSSAHGDDKDAGDLSDADEIIGEDGDIIRK